MMYLLDTCAFIWYLEGSNKLSPKAASILDTCPDIFLSLTTLWEIAIKKTIRPLMAESFRILAKSPCDSPHPRHCFLAGDGHLPPSPRGGEGFGALSQVQQVIKRFMRKPFRLP